MKRWLMLSALLVPAVAGLIHSARHSGQTSVGAGGLWGWLGEAQHEASRVPTAATRLSDAEEIRIGHEIALRSPAAVPCEQCSADDVAFQDLVNRVGQRLAVHARRKLPYTFSYFADPHFFNALALPGGHIVIGRGLALVMDTEDQLAAVLGHEIEHVDRYHCAERIQFEARARHVPLGGLLVLPISLFQAGYTKDQELEADREGTALAVRAGYSPQGAVRLLEIFARLEEAQRQRRGASDPVSESADASLQGLSEYFRSHPQSNVRKRTVEALIKARRWPLGPERLLVPRVFDRHSRTPLQSGARLGLAGRQTDDNLCPSLSFFVLRYRRLNSVTGVISSGTDSTTERP
jgi:predicted Zn-dependent protease